MKKLNFKLVVIAIPIFTSLLVGCGLNATNKPVDLKQTTNNVPETVTTQTLKTKLYSLTVPKYWTVDIQQDVVLTFQKDGKKIGGLEIESYTPPDSVSYPNHSLLIDKKKLDGFFTDVIRINFNTQLPAASGDTSVTNETHFYFLLKDQTVAYDLYFNQSVIDEQTIMSIAKSITQS